MFVVEVSEILYLKAVCKLQSSTEICHSCSVKIEKEIYRKPSEALPPRWLCLLCSLLFTLSLSPLLCPCSRPTQSFLTWIIAIASSQLPYHSLKFILHAAATVIFLQPKSAHLSPLRNGLHWFSSTYRWQTRAFMIWLCQPFQLH